MNWILLIITLPSENTAGRMRTWRAIKASGAAVLRDGVYLLPELDSCLTAFKTVLTDVQNGGGSAYLLKAHTLQDVDLPSLFLRDAEFAALLQDIGMMRQNGVASAQTTAAFKKTNKLRKMFAQLVAIDFFPNAAQQQANTALTGIEQAIRQRMSPDEPYPVAGELEPLPIGDYLNKIWATRHRPWADRLASAWLIRRFIDPQARFIWLASPSECPPDAVGFDFDGATFSHIGHYVTFEVLLKRFQLEQAALKRVAALVHYLDVGGVQPSEASGIESVLKGLRHTLNDDDHLLAAAGNVFDGLLATFTMMTEE